VGRLLCAVLSLARSVLKFLQSLWENAIGKNFPEEELFNEV
jgi:hypothetical protein